jgi:hypothetical protein
MKPYAIGVAAIILGAIGIGLPAIVLTAHPRPEVWIGAMICGAIILGSGVIATAIGLKE